MYLLYCIDFINHVIEIFWYKTNNSKEVYFHVTFNAYIDRITSDYNKTSLFMGKFVTLQTFQGSSCNGSEVEVVLKDHPFYFLLIKYHGYCFYSTLNMFSYFKFWRKSHINNFCIKRPRQNALTILLERGQHGWWNKC